MPSDQTTEIRLKEVEPRRVESTRASGRAALAGLLMTGSWFATLALPSQAQHQQSNQQHHQTGTAAHKGKPAQHFAPALSQSQMANMLDEVSSGQSPTLPAHSNVSNNPAQAHGMTGMHPLSGNIVRPPAGGLINHSGMGGGMGIPHLSGMGTLSRGMGMSHGGGLGMSHGVPGGGVTRPSGMGMAGHGIMGHNIMPMGTMGGGAGMAHSSMTGGGAAQFMQQFKQKFGALMPAAGMGGEQEGGVPGGMGGMPGGMSGMPGGMGGMPGGMGGMPRGGGGMPGGMGGMPGGGGMQAQLMQRLFQGQAPGGGASRPTNNFPANRSARPLAQSQDDVIKRPPGVNGMPGGASPNPNRTTSSSTASDLERQMEQQYGK